MKILPQIKIDYSQSTTFAGSYDLEVPIGEEILFSFAVWRNRTTPYEFPSGTTWEFGIDNSRNTVDTDLIFSEEFNGDWDEASEDPAEGYLACLVNTNTEELRAMIGTKARLECVAELYATEPGEERELIGRFNVTILNSVIDESSPVPSAANNRAVTVDVDGALVSPNTFWTANAEDIYAAIASQVEADDDAGDNLGNHTATQALAMAGHNITNVGTVQATTLQGDASSATFGGTMSGNLVGVSNVQGLAQAFDAFTGSDNLGNHTATQDLDLDGNDLVDVGTVGATTLQGNGDAITTTATLDGNLSGVTPNLSAIVTAIDNLELGGGGGAAGGTIPFNYMALSKGFSTSAIGWVTGINNTTYRFTYGGYKSASSTMVSAETMIHYVIPAGATGFHPSKPFEISFISTSNSTSNCKVDIKVYRSIQHQTPQEIYSNTGYCPATANVPATLSATYLEEWDSAYDRITLCVTFYSKSDYCVQVIDGAFHFT